MPDLFSAPTLSTASFFFDRTAFTGTTTGDDGVEIEGHNWRGGSNDGADGRGIHSAPRVSYYFPKGVGEYHFGERHPMKPHRLTLTNHLVIGYGLHIKMDMYNPRAATAEELEAFHDQDYVDFLSRVTPDNVREFTNVLSSFNVGDDCPIFSDMWDYCRQYAGASLMAARKLVTGSTDIAINWTGGLHHAKKAEASGFCYVNDIVLAILELLRVHARVLYIDIDIHHGDGVQEAFYNSNRVMTASFHKYSSDFFPGTGHIDEIGHSQGKHFSLNIPLQDGIDNESYVALFKAVMEPTINTFRPSSIVLQCGADSLGCDRLGCFNLSIAAHGECVRYIKSFDLPLLVLGGGGYTIKNVARCWAYETSVLLGMHQTLPASLPHTPYDDFFAPDWRLHPELTSSRNRVENLNSRKSLERIRIAALERLRYMHGAPSVGMTEIPPSLAPWLEEERKKEEIEQEANEEGSGDHGNRDRAPVFEGVGMATAMVARPRMAPVSSGLAGPGGASGGMPPYPPSTAGGRGGSLDGNATTTTITTTPGGSLGGALGFNTASGNSNKKRRKGSSASGTVSSHNAGAGSGPSAGSISARSGKILLEGTLLPPLPGSSAGVKPRMDVGSVEDER